MYMAWPHSSSTCSILALSFVRATTSSYPWRFTSSRRHRQSYRLEKSAKITDIPMSGPVVKNHNLFKSDRKTQCNTENSVPIVVPGLSPALPVPLQVRLQHRYRRTPRKTLRQVQRPYDVEVILFEEMSETKIKSKREVIQEAQKEQRTAWQMDKLQRKRDVILEAQREKRKVHFATLLDICDLKNAELEPNFQKYKGRVVLRGDIVKDGSGSYAVCTERGSSAWRLQK